MKTWAVLAVLTTGFGSAGAEEPRIAARVVTPEIPHTLPDGYLVLPFDNQSGVAGIEWMRVGLPAALGEKLEAHPGLRAVYGAKILPDGAPLATVDVATVAPLAAGVGATFVWSGSYTRKNWKLEFTLRLWMIGDDGAAALVGENTQFGDYGKAFAMLDTAALDLLTKAGRPAPTAIEELIARPPSGDFYAFTLYGRGLMALHGLGKTPDLVVAAKNLTKAVFIDPKFAEAHRLLAVVHQAKGEPAKARGQLTYALDLRPDYYAPLAALVQSAYLSKDRTEAIELSTRALALRPWDVNVRYLLGEMLWEDGDEEGAYLELSRLVAFRPDHLAGRRVLVLIHASQGDGSKLALELEEIIKLDPTDDAAKLDLGAAYHDLGRDQDAIGIYEEIVKAHPKHLQALKFLGDIYKAQGDLAGAISWYEKALAANRNDPRPYFLLGAAYVQAGQDKKAIRVYLQAQKFPRYLGDAYTNLGAIHYRRGNNGEALWYLKYAVLRRPTSAKAHYNYGLALSRAHKRDLALTEIVRASMLDPNDADVRYAMGVVLLRMGKIEDAEAAFKECVRLAPEHEDGRYNLQLIEELRRRAREGEIQIE